MAKKTSKPSKQSSATTKTQKILDLLKRAIGASIAELAKATDWHNHSVRGFISGTVKKKLGIEIVSTREADKDRRYLIKTRAGVAS